MKRNARRPESERREISAELGPSFDPRRGARLWRGLWVRIVALLVVVIAIAWLRSLLRQVGP